MTTTRTTGRDHRRFRLATNDNETMVNGLRRAWDTDVDDELDTEGHRLATNDNETVVITRAKLVPGDPSDEGTRPSAARR